MLFPFTPPPFESKSIQKTTLIYFLLLCFTLPKHVDYKENRTQSFAHPTIQFVINPPLLSEFKNLHCGISFKIHLTNISRKLECKELLLYAHYMSQVGPHKAPTTATGIPIF